MSGQRESGAEYARTLRERKSRGQGCASVILAVVAVIWLVVWLVAALASFSASVLLGILFAAIAIGGAILWAVIGYAAFRKARPPAFPGEISIDPDEPRRGDKVRLRLVRHGHTHQGEECEVGVIAVERYDVTESDSDGGSSRSTRETNEFEQWISVATTIGEETIEMQIPVEGPFSYEGDALSFRWRAEAKIHRKMRPDRRAVAPFWVHP
jgi:hypothetical protein